MKVENNKMVALRYWIKTHNGSVMADIMNEQPFRYVVGSGGILPALEQNIYGMEPGGQKSFVLLKAEQPGLFEDLYVDVIIDEVTDDVPEKVITSTDSTCSGHDCCC
jgi:FKBP-type peptidyl-prolyl cis-trans isomerase 2